MSADQLLVRVPRAVGRAPNDGDMTPYRRRTDAAPRSTAAEPPPGTEGMRGYACWVASHASGLTGRGRDSRWSTGRRLAVWW